MTWYKTIKWNIPNVLSAYRLASFPILLSFIFLKYETLFAWFFCFNLITDIADGFIARKWNLQTPEGAILDSLADFGSYILALVGIAQFHSFLFTENYLFPIFIGLFVFATLIPMIKYRRPAAGLHLYSAKIAGYSQGIFFFVLFAFGFNWYFFLPAMYIGYYTEIESVFINLHAKEPQLNTKTAFHYFKKIKNENSK